MRGFAFLTLALATPATAQVSRDGTPIPPKEAWRAPTLTNERYDEDWTRLSDPAVRGEHWTGALKYIPIGPEAYVTTGIELRARSEHNRHILWEDDPAADDGYLWLRALPYADLHASRGRVSVRGFVQPILGYAIGVAPEASPIDQTRADLLQGFADVRLGAAEAGGSTDAGGTIRVGRQMLSLGTERLVGTRYGPNLPLAFDGFRALISTRGATISLLAVRPVQPGRGDFDDRLSRARSLWGAYATLPALIPGSGLDLYYLSYRNTVAAFGAEVGDERRHTVGARIYGRAGGWHWNVEGVAQVGTFARDRIRAWSVGSEVGRTFPDAPLAPDAVLRLNVVSGDRRWGDGTLGRFNALFPKGKYFGELSPVGPANIVNVNPRVSANLGSGVSASVAGNAYWRYTVGDGVYDVPGNLIRAPGTSDARFIGKEVEVTLAWQATPELELSASVSAFSAGEFIRRTGSGRTISMVGLESNFRF